MRAIDRTLSRPATVDPGPAPMLQWIEIDLLVVDERYQRSLQANNWSAIRRIAEVFDWSKFSTVHVAPIEGGKFAIIDGQHRTHAAAACGFASVPCQVTHMTVEEQASAFAAINGLVTKVTPFQIFKAALAAGEAWALELQAVCAESGCVAVTYKMSNAHKKAGEIHGLQYLRGTIERRGRDAVVTALTAIRQADGMGDSIDFYAQATFRPVLEALLSRPHALRDPVGTRAILDRTDIWALVEKADKFLAERRRNGLPSITRLDALESLVGDAIDAGFRKAAA